MKDVEKTKEQLIAELQDIRERLAYLEASDSIISASNPTQDGVTQKQSSDVENQYQRLFSSVRDGIDVSEMNGSAPDAAKAFLDILNAEKLESIGLLAGGIAHDFNNILTAILINISIARRALDSDGEIQSRLSDAEKATYQARGLTQQLLTLSQGGTPVKKIVSITEMLQDTTTFILNGSNIKYDLYIPDDLWTVDIDQGQIYQAISNLIVNSQQAMIEGGTVTIWAENITMKAEHNHFLKPGNYVKISVEDQGIGIPKHQLKKIFDPYFTTKHKGSGLGLATAYSAVKKNGGLISVESKVGAGTTFHVFLPASGNKSAAIETVHDECCSGAGKILVMDDAESVRDAVCRMLKHVGYTEVEYARDGREAIQLYKEALESGKSFDAVIIDLTVHDGMGGKETIKELKKIDPGIRSIVSTGYVLDPVVTQYKEYGFCGFVTKPYTINELSTVLHQVIVDTH